VNRSINVALGFLFLVLIAVNPGCSQSSVQPFSSTSTLPPTSTSLTSATSMSPGLVNTTQPPTGTTPFTWSLSSDCTTCHAGQVKSMAETTLLAYKHTTVSNNCTGCHDTATLQASHKSVSANSPVPAKTYPQSFCLNCHDSYSSLIALTINRKASIIINGRGINPHDTMIGQADCSVCHTIHGESRGMRVCFNCH
jgi:hypothetical protein